MIRPATENDHATLINVWEASVRATHHFLPEAYLQEIKQILPHVFSLIPVHVYELSNGDVCGFAGVDSGKIEMLFLHPDVRGKGIGREMIRFCMQELAADKVDVNEQNQQAVDFYKHIGFTVTGRSELDGAGKPFPLLHMQMATSINN
ncbi:GNAT family N-acetyltransferase [Lacibacter luteus]|uniref:GNAT family N-acetyltransferase n=1 Tax=Lacibacter luteus TaxID=2508719 RepID=A0A4Q1CG73_9BACT|nr:GNAT family N-acetyltransferase [Lacibacter luteus]RXK58917.1 GNAT family N-acetyltransferase [Lacibacter luteus]